MNAFKLLARSDLATARAHFAAACVASREHVSMAASALAVYGDRGPLIAGCIRDHFPQPVRDSLRDLALMVGRASDAAWAARPARVRAATMRALSRAVAARDGSGYYGPRP
jgi:hypothetical protein